MMTISILLILMIILIIMITFWPACFGSTESRGGSFAAAGGPADNEIFLLNEIFLQTEIFPPVLSRARRWTDCSLWVQC